MDLRIRHSFSLSSLEHSSSQEKYFLSLNIFRNLEETRWDIKYKMVTRCPNWNHRVIQVGEEGYLTYDDYEAGKSQWFDGKDFHYYRYTMSQFIKFIEKPKQQADEYIM